MIYYESDLILGRNIQVLKNIIVIYYNYYDDTVVYREISTYAHFLISQLLIYFLDYIGISSNDFDHTPIISHIRIFASFTCS